MRGIGTILRCSLVPLAQALEVDLFVTGSVNPIRIDDDIERLDRGIVERSGGNNRRIQACKGAVRVNNNSKQFHDVNSCGKGQDLED